MSDTKIDSCFPTVLATRVAVLEERTTAAGRIADERDRFYLEKFKASEVAVGAAITAQKEQTTSSFAASEKAIVKAEEAQREYNVRSNEFRGQLDDQAKRLMPREEAVSNFKSVDDKLEEVKKSIDILRENSKKDIADLRETRSNVLGGVNQHQRSQAQMNWSIGILLVIALAIINHFWK